MQGYAEGEDDDAEGDYGEDDDELALENDYGGEDDEAALLMY